MSYKRNSAAVKKLKKVLDSHRKRSEIVQVTNCIGGETQKQKLKQNKTLVLSTGKK